MGWLNNLVSALGNKLNAPPPPNPAPAVPAPPAPAPPPPDLGNPNAMAGAPTPGAYGSLAVQPAQPVAPPAGPTKAHKLLTILQGGLQGALAGRASSEQALIQSGGHRSGGAGMGFEAGYNLPWQHAMQQQQLAQAQAQTEATRGQSSMIMTPSGPMPAWLAKAILPASIRGQSTENAADTRAGASVQGAQIGAQGRVQAAQINKKFMPVPGVGLYDTSTNSVVPGTAQGVTLTQEHLNEFNLPKEFLGKQMSLQQLAGLERAQSGQMALTQGAEGPALVNKINAKTTPLGLGNPSIASKMAGGVQIGDPDNPGETKFTTMGNAIKTGAAGPGSASVVVPRTAAKAEVPTKIGDLKVGFTTMIQHADLLRQAARAVNNGDNQTLAGLKNRFKNEFGYEGPITAEAIADAYKGEVSNVINKGHITDTGNEKIAHTLDPNKQNFKTVDSVLGAYQALAQSKMNMLGKQEQAAINSSQVRKSAGRASTNYTPPSGAPSATGPNGHRIVVDKGKWVDAQTGAPI